LCKAFETWCGDGEVNDAGEQCDDGNQNDNDGCTNQCKSGQPSLHIEKSADKTTIVPGESVTYLPIGYTLQ